ncbi:DUF6612 family protein [Paenibacillus alvei]|uniref:DUF6612 family protein n=1 Tax=Paenibacillus alvei TaxID=44250 RepID=UPI0018CD7A55|nr:DUF6612 family protein [Paenibacillus alvei]MBG9734848.1 hypothetical protein [Paenibacillus alvei]MBG9744723.1 hypothetical protein [Paenibacillus alvei]MCY9578855.1 hypothetical protein [Paenibacillus alvei]MCY9583911.1 hypothetical protein [Paenibacillus alvei]
MKKWVALLLGAILVVSMTACGDKKDAAGTNSSSTAQTTTDTEKKEASLPTVDELIQKSIDASKSLKNFAMDAQIKTDLTISQGEQKQEQNTEMKLKSDITKEPFNLYQEMTMTVTGQGEQKIVQYISKDGIYSQMNGQWTKMPDDMKAQVLEGAEKGASPEQSLEQFKSIAKDTKVSEAGNDYILTADLSGDGMKELAKSLMSQSGSNSNPQMAAMLDQMNIKSIKMTYGVNKDTHLPTKSDVDMTMDVEEQGQKVEIHMVMNSTFSKHNEIGEIKVPKEVLDSVK